MARRDSLTMELPGMVRRVGRPSTGKAKSGAQRQKAYRKRLKAALEAKTVGGGFPQEISQPTSNARQQFSSRVTEIQPAQSRPATPRFSSCRASTTATKSTKPD